MKFIEVLIMLMIYQGIFLESKSLENVSRRRIFLKLHQNGNLGNLLNLYIVTEKVN